MNLSDNLKKIRKDNNLSQEQLAEKLGVSRQSVSKWESGLAYPEMDKVLQICKMFNLNVDELLNQNIKEVKETKESKANVNKFIDDFLNFITKIIDMFSSMKFKEKIKCLFEQVIVCFILAIVFSIIGGLAAFLLSSIFHILPDVLYYNLSGIAWTIYIVFSIVAGFAILLHIFKVRYLDYYVIVKSEDDNIEEKSVNNNNIEKEELNKSEQKEKIYLEKKKEKIIIRDPNHSQYKFIKVILKCVIFFIKLFVAGMAIMFSFSLVFFVVSLVLSFLIVKTGLLFFGSFITIISCIIVNLLILYVLYNFIFSKKSKKNIVAIIFVSTLILTGIGTGLVTMSIKDFNYIDDINSKHFLSEEKVIDMRDDLIIDENYESVEYIESDNTDIRIVCKHSKYYKFQINNHYKDNLIFLYSYENNDNIMGLLRDSLKDLNNKEVINYSKSKIYIYTTKENIDKLKTNFKNYNEQQRQNRIDEQFNNYEERISELLDESEEQQEKIYNLEQQIEEKNDKITELENDLRDYNNYINN